MEPQPTILVVVATYNEIDNLPRLIYQINELLPHADILVIDDASPDGTGNWCEQAKTQYSQLSVVHRKGKLGLGSAAAEGFAIAIEKKYQLVATLDADLSHSPQSLAEMMDLLADPTNADIGVVVGSRYVAGGGTEGWPLLRRIASKMINFYSRLILGLKTKDNSGAFRVYRISALNELDISQLKSTDYAYLEEVLWKLQKSGVKMLEHPIVFRNRELGQSKTSFLLGLKVIWQIAIMRLGR